MIRTIFINLFFVLLFIACGKDEEEDDVVRLVDTTQPLSCLRWVDRDLFLATQNNNISIRNNRFHKEELKTILRNIEKNSMLGEGYFRIKEVNEAVIDPMFNAMLPPKEMKSFIQIWEDDKFNQYLNTYFGSNIRDPNAIIVTNPTNLRKFYIILKASCFQKNNNCRTEDGSLITHDGLSALISRQFGFLFGVPTDNCSINPNSIMCPELRNSQWNNKKTFFNNLTDNLQNRVLNPNSYGDYQSMNNCLHTEWMDRNINLACPSGLNNSPFHMEFILDTMNEIASMTKLGASYFNGQDCTPESQIPIHFEENVLDRTKESYLLIYQDIDFNRFVNDNEIPMPDSNAMLMMNEAKKSNFTLMLRQSCLDVFDEKCDGGEFGGVSSRGSKALIARQMARMVGVELKDCAADPYNVMCANMPSDFQWRNSFYCFENYSYRECQEKLEACIPAHGILNCTKVDNTGIVDQEIIEINSIKKFVNEFNNALEVIGNFPDFYKENRPE